MIAISIRLLTSAAMGPGQKSRPGADLGQRITVCRKCVGYSSNNTYFAADPVKVSTTRLGLALAILVFSHSALSLDPSTAITECHQNVWGEGDGLQQGSDLGNSQQFQDSHSKTNTKNGLCGTSWNSLPGNPLATKKMRPELLPAPFETSVLSPTVSSGNTAWNQ